MRLVLSRFDPSKKVKIVYAIPDQNINDGIQTHLEELYTIYIEENPNSESKYYELGSYLSYIFKVNSAWNDNTKDTLILTLYLEEHENTHFFKPIMEKTISDLREIPHLTKIISVGTPHAEKGAYSILGKVIKELTMGYFEASKLHSTYNLGLSEVLVLGDKGSGKTSIIDFLIHGKFIPQINPTLTPQVFRLVYDQTDFRVLDVCCDEHIKEIFESHPIEKGKLPQAIVYVVDASQTKEDLEKSAVRFGAWMMFLSKKYSMAQFKSIPLLVLFNKVDLNPQFGLEKYRDLFTPDMADLNIKYSTSSVKTGEGLENNFSWLVKGIKVTETY